MSSMPTHDTTKLSLAFAVTAFRMPTGVASLAGVSRIHQDNPHTSKPCLVADKLSQLAESPIAVSRPSRFPYRRPRANVRQVFKRNRPLRVFGFLNKLLCNAMVRILLKAPLLARQFPQVAFGRKAAALLQPSAQVCVPAALAFDTPPAVPFTIAVGCQICDAQVNPKHAIYCLLVRFRYVADGQHVERASVVDQIAFAFARRQQSALVFARAVRDVLASLQRPDRNRALVGIPRQVAIIEGEGTVGLKRALGLAVQCVGISNFGDAANETLCSQSEGSLMSW